MTDKDTEKLRREIAKLCKAVNRISNMKVTVLNKYSRVKGPPPCHK